MRQQGIVCFHTCFNLTVIPAAYIRDLCIQTLQYTQGTNAERHAAVAQALDSWFLLQVLNAIGKHSII